MKSDVFLVLYSKYLRMCCSRPLASLKGHNTRLLHYVSCYKAPLSTSTDVLRPEFSVQYIVVKNMFGVNKSVRTRRSCRNVSILQEFKFCWRQKMELIKSTVTAANKVATESTFFISTECKAMSLEVTAAVWTVRSERNVLILFSNFPLGINKIYILDNCWILNLIATQPNA